MSCKIPILRLLSALQVYMRAPSQVNWVEVERAFKAVKETPRMAREPANSDDASPTEPIGRAVVRAKRFLQYLRRDLDPQGEGHILTILRALEKAEQERDEARMHEGAKSVEIDFQKDRNEQLRECITALEAELKEAQSKHICMMGVGDGSGKLYVHGDYESIKAAQKTVFDLREVQKERDKYWHLLCRTVEAMGKISPEAAPYADQWAEKLKQELDDAKTEIGRLKTCVASEQMNGNYWKDLAELRRAMQNRNEKLENALKTIGDNRPAEYDLKTLLRFSSIAGETVDAALKSKP